MSKMNEMDTTIKELRDIASSINSIANWLCSTFSDGEQANAEPTKEEPKALTLPEVRAILAEKSRAGFTAEIKELLLKHGADKLSAVAPSEYEALVAEAEELNNAT